jgi:hypothetical protein
MRSFRVFQILPTFSSHQRQHSTAALRGGRNPLRLAHWSRKETFFRKRPCALLNFYCAGQKLENKLHCRVTGFHARA